jgi:hypothetical protein
MVSLLKLITPIGALALAVVLLVISARSGLYA